MPKTREEFQSAALSIETLICAMLALANEGEDELVAGLLETAHEKASALNNDLDIINFKDGETIQ